MFDFGWLEKQLISGRHTGFHGYDLLGSWKVFFAQSLDAVILSLSHMIWESTKNHRKLDKIIFHLKMLDLFEQI